MQMMSGDPGRVFTLTKQGWEDSVDRLLLGAGLAGLLAEQRRLLIKPNLVEALPPPITTPVRLIESLVRWLRRHAPHLDIVIGEGTGSISYDTFHCFTTLGYTEMAHALDIELVDLNTLPQSRRELPECRRWPELHLPQMLSEVFLLSVPVLKAHSLAGVTLTMKNMMGCACPAHYQKGGCWGKSAFHDQIQEAVFDLNRYRAPDFTLLDATIGMSQAHLWGPHCNPPPGLLAASADPVAIDSYGCSLLGRRWQDIGHIRMADGVLGRAHPVDITAL